MPPVAAAGAASQRSRRHAGRQARTAEAQREADAVRRVADHRKLRHAGDEHRPAKDAADGSAAQPTPGRAGEGGDGDDVEERRGERGDEEAAVGVEDAAQHRRQRHADQIGEHDAEEIDGEVELLRIRR